MLLHNIRRQCNIKALTIKQLEQMANISPNSLFRWDEIMPAADKLARVVAVLETTVEALLSDGEWE